MKLAYTYTVSDSKNHSGSRRPARYSPLIKGANANSEGLTQQ